MKCVSVLLLSLFCAVGIAACGGSERADRDDGQREEQDLHEEGERRHEHGEHERHRPVPLPKRIPGEKLPLPPKFPGHPAPEPIPEPTL